MIDRRTLLKGLAAAGAVSLLPDASVFAQGTTRLNVPGGAIDVHHHFMPPGQSAGARPWTPELTLAFAGISTRSERLLLVVDDVRHVHARSAGSLVMTMPVLVISQCSWSPA